MGSGWLSDRFGLVRSRESRWRSWPAQKFFGGKMTNRVIPRSRTGVVSPTGWSRHFLKLFLGAGLLALSVGFSAGEAGAFEAVDGRLQAHGYVEMQFRTISDDFSDQWDLTAWYNIFNLELEFDLVKETHGPLDLMSAFVRVEARFDCIYSRGCGMFKGANTFGNRARGLPKRLQNGDEYTNAGAMQISNDGTYSLSPQRNPYPFQQTPGLRGIYDASDEGLGAVNRTKQMQCGEAASLEGASAYCPDAAVRYVPTKVQPRFWNANRNRRTVEPGSLTPVDDGTNGSPFLIAMQDFRDFELTAISFPGGSNYGNNLLIMGPWLPKNFVQTNAALAELPNAIDNSRVAPQSLVYGSGGRPMRAIPIFREDNPGRDQIWIEQTEPLGANDTQTLPTGRWETINPTEGRFSDVRMWNDRAARPDEARGAFVPTSRLRKALQEDKFTPYPFNISQMDRSFNRGWSQNDEGELKEAYLDIEMFDSRLWLRVGKQSIVWGKTELFRTTDQFNPQDFALATLPSLEESRINLWAARGVWSFYEVGPLVDVRLELAMNFDQYESADLGACGEPYAVNLVCGLTFGSWAHGVTGVGVAGFTAPPDPWENSRGLEFGGRLEWRWDRYSFALVDFYGYADFPYAARLSTYSRNVDWESGRPRFYMHTPADLASANNRCLRPDGMGVAQSGGANYDFNQAPDQAGAYVDYNGSANAGCLTPGASNRQVRVLEALPSNLPSDSSEWANGFSGEWYGVPFVNPAAPNNDGNDFRDYKGIFRNNTVLSDVDDPRPDYSTPTQGDPNIQGIEAYESYTASALFFDDPRFSDEFKSTVAGCGSNPLYVDTASGQVVEQCTDQGRRRFDTEMYISVNDVTLPNPGFNPFYDPRLDPYLDPRQAQSIEYFTNPGNATPQTIVDPNCDVGAVQGSIRYDPFQRWSSTGNGCRLSKNKNFFWANSFDPNMAYDERNALDMVSVNNSIFQFVCANTVGFSALDPSSCALTVFSSAKENPDAENSPRTSFIISGFLSGASTLNGFVGEIPTNSTLSKGPLLPFRFGMPLLQLHYDLPTSIEGDPNLGQGPTIGAGLDAFRTLDVRRNWFDRNNPNFDPADYWIYSREGESYNCLSEEYLEFGNGASALCGGVGIGDPSKPVQFRYEVNTYLSKALSPEQEALLGCGPYFLTSCDANGADFLWAEGSALVGSFIGSDSLGIAFSKMGIQDLVPEAFGAFLMDNGSPSNEYRTDGKVIGKNGRLIRIDQDSLTPVLGEVDGLWRGAGVGNVGSLDAGGVRGDCDITTDRIIDANGNEINSDRTSARCWDLRQYFIAYGVQPGTAAHEILGLASPKCTTADIGGPIDPVGGVLPGCRNKWATIQYQPLDTWDGEIASLHPNNPDAGYIGNNWYGQRFSYKLVNPFLAEDPFFGLTRSTALNVNADPDPRSDYRQLNFDPDGTGNPCVDPAAPDGPESYDCYVRNPSYVPAPNDFDPGWLDVYAPDGPKGQDLQDYLPASIRLHSSWTTNDVRYKTAEFSQRSGLNWGVYDPVLSGCDPSRPQQQLQDDPDCYVGGWRQTVDGDPDRLGIGPQYAAADSRTVYPRYQPAFGNIDDVNNLSAGNGIYGNWVASPSGLALTPDAFQGGCTQTRFFKYLQVDASNAFVSMPECVNVFLNPGDKASELLYGAGHPFTGESFASEIAGTSFNLMQLLVTFSSEFSDGLASVRGFVNPEIYESRFIYDEEWMWNPQCLPVELGGTTDSEIRERCGGRNFVADVNPVSNTFGPNGNNYFDSGCQGRNGVTYQQYCLHSAYGNPNRDPHDVKLLRFDQGAELTAEQRAKCVTGSTDLSGCLRVRQAFNCENGTCTGSEPSQNRVILRERVGWQGSGLGNRYKANGSLLPGTQNEPPTNPTPGCEYDSECYREFVDDDAAARETAIPDPLLEGEENTLQRDPSLPNILTMFPDLLLRECKSAQRNYQAGMNAQQIRGLYDNCGRVTYLTNGQIDPQSGVNDWDSYIDGKGDKRYYQEIRLGRRNKDDPTLVEGGLVNTMAWDYAFTGTENDLMAMIPYCEDLEYSQRFINETQGDLGQKGFTAFGPGRIDCSKGLEGKTLGRERCNYVTPQFCGLVQAVLGLAGQKRPLRRAGGNGTFGRRTMQWQSGNEVYLDYEKRNVLGFSMDFAEDYTKSNWSMEFTWIEGVPQFDSLSYDLTTKTDDFNFTVSMDRPTFVNFLNANRTFFINSQWFFQYRKGWNDQFQSIGPWNVLATFAVFTGYFQDRLNPQLVFVYDFRSVSGGALPQVNYRFSENFSITVGVSLFWGEDKLVPMGINPIAPAGPRAGPNPYTNGIQPGLSIVRDRDEAFMILRYTF
ncbi:MAG: hypothetical protein CBC48_17485 [bacterium TMED88]|nr:hypothetical protein [Deltaproteobacteria bacterium]OUV24423.1 MAG: hypothetical protein CBC48_17485 [bacterium TMED88]